MMIDTNTVTAESGSKINEPSKNTISRLNSLLEKNRLGKLNYQIVGASVYFNLDELHGPLGTRGRKDAKRLLNEKYSRWVMKYSRTFVPGLLEQQDLTRQGRPRNRIEQEKKEDFVPGDYIAWTALNYILDDLAQVKFKRSNFYRSIHAYMSTWIASNPTIHNFNLLYSAELEQRQRANCDLLRAVSKRCCLSKLTFEGEFSCEIHHIKPKWLFPENAHELENLLPLGKPIHRDYHSWCEQNDFPVNRASLFKYALANNYATNFLEERDELFTSF